MIQATHPVDMPARTLNQWWITRLQISVNPGTDKVALSYNVTLGDPSGPAVNQSQQPRMIADAAALFAGDPSSLATWNSVLSGIETLVQQDMQKRGVL